MAKMAEKIIYINALKDIIQVVYTTPLVHKNHSVVHDKFNVSHNSNLKPSILIFYTENGQNGQKITFSAILAILAIEISKIWDKWPKWPMAPPILFCKKLSIASHNRFYW